MQAGHLPDVYALRVQALDGPVTALDFARILLHLMQRRGFRSNRKADDAQKDGKLLQAIGREHPTYGGKPGTVLSVR